MGKEKYEIVKFEDGDFKLDVKVSLEEDTVWLTLNELSILFNRNKSVISRHIQKILAEGELLENQTVAKKCNCSI